MGVSKEPPGRPDGYLKGRPKRRSQPNPEAYPPETQALGMPVSRCAERRERLPMELIASDAPGSSASLSMLIDEDVIAVGVRQREARRTCRGFVGLADESDASFLQFVL